VKAADVKKALHSLADPEQAVNLSRFFKTGKGEYGQGDIFIGVKVPAQRSIARRFMQMPLPELKLLLTDPVHECRLTALMILVDKYSKSDAPVRGHIFHFYTANTEYINNWDLVDLSCEKIVGRHLYTTGLDRKILYDLAARDYLWDQRIAVVSTYWFIKNRQFEDTIRLCEFFLGHKHDLIHKATGWMLREAGKRDINVLRKFLDHYAAVMPRTMLRYSIEKLEKTERQKYMNARSAGKMLRNR